MLKTETGNPQEILLYAGNASDSKEVRESLLAYPLDNRHYKLAISPALVLGIAMGDVINIIDLDHGYFELIKRGGNISIQVYSDSITVLEPYLTQKLVALSGFLDGINNGVCVYTVPASAGFDKIESVFSDVMTVFKNTQWYYGNVYADDDETPLNWW